MINTTQEDVAYLQKEIEYSIKQWIHSFQIPAYLLLHFMQYLW